MTALFAILAALTCYCCCVVAGEADRQMEELWRRREEDRHDDGQDARGA